ncbi:bola-like protein [Stereum hirsutum FP-91666 SS1]|uniref:bola-like protein n=1 Tax=Stereum hirsutum (strain FP-91666) TaxID=721885 RepID=UPI0004410118|nr:bola-like protein [Stereum hirsutum FP-91666 SS1]EIM88169.1 bola-like protein [Stereum hirsutum FP-91666 SS1]
MFSLLSRRASTSVLWSRPLHSSAWRSSAAATSLPLPTGLDDGEKAIFQKLTERFNPSELLVQDVSGGCGSFYAIQIKSEAFKGIPMIKQHRMVNDTLKKEIEGIHGLQLKTIPQ